MSRIGKKPIQIPEGVEIKIEDGRVAVKGPKGELDFDLPSGIKIEIQRKKDKIIALVVPLHPSKRTRSLWGTTRALIDNMIKGVQEGYEKKLELVGVGYRAEVRDRELVLNVGFSHSVKILAPKGIDFRVEKNIIIVSGIEKQKVGQIAAEIRSVRKPEPYKGKGIRYVGEIIRRKAGKKVVTAT